MPAARTALLAFALACLLPTAAFAGGVGGFDVTGFHFGAALGQAGGTGQWMDQGAGFEALLGKRDKRVAGRLRLAWHAVIDLDTGATLHAGVFSAGAQVELLPGFEDRKVGLYLVGDVGVSPLVTNLRTFVFFDVGPGLRVQLADRVSLFAEVTGWLRYEKGFAGGPLVFVGARVALD